MSARLLLGIAVLCCLSVIFGKVTSQSTECTDSSDCGPGHCCALYQVGGQYNTPTCSKLRAENEDCMANNNPYDYSFAYPNGVQFKSTNIYWAVCPCDTGLSCENSVCSSDNSRRKRSSDANSIYSSCITCICEAASNGAGNCGHITWAFWSDAGKPTLYGAASANAYSSCVNNPECASRTILGYLNKFSKDCNGDGVINCLDHAMTYMYGGYGCGGSAQGPFFTRFRQCSARFGLNQGWEH